MSDQSYRLHDRGGSQHRNVASHSPGNLLAELGPIAPPQGALEGRILIIEDLTKTVIADLGSALQIDPLFFASHLDTPAMDVNSTAPDKVTLPSRLRPKDYINIHYHRTIRFSENSNLPEGHLTLRQDGICISRKVTILTRIKKIRIGLAQHCVSVYWKMQQGGHWLGIILTDPKVSDRYIQETSNGTIAVTYGSRPFAAGYEDFEEPNFHFPQSIPLNRCQNLMDDLLQYLRPGGYNFGINSPTVLGLSYFPLRIVAGEWMNYILIMSYSIKEYEPKGGMPRRPETGMDLKELQRWRRRALASEQKIDAVVRFLGHQRTRGARNLKEQRTSHIEDWIYLSKNLRACSSLLENMAQVAQIVDARRSADETRNTTRLTTLALFFIPFSLLSSIFSMNGKFAAGAPLFWVYFVAAVLGSLILYVFVGREKVLRLWRRRRS
ncbi:hypothetical protein B0J11DRAFT_60515 [Dendryphion nanum]|uniref:Uncharacterized protein n=1 Tax=Dendryphion nanum TaxID=256645 RepID=A0A9P9DL45_9PLEO|nr:hypothetical protein B0J11DRAFT_60515 [Dendryphion nanum]